MHGTSLFQLDGNILLCAGIDDISKCLKLEGGAWVEHSSLNKRRVWEMAVPTKTATFIFGGIRSRRTYEYLPKDSTTWLMGKTEIPGGFHYGSVIATKSEKEILLIGGTHTEERILSFNVNDHTFQELPSKLNVGRHRHRCAFIPNTNKIMITGGTRGWGSEAGWRGHGWLDSAEILDTEDWSVTIASPINLKRCAHGMGVVKINGEDRLAVFGGFDGVHHAIWLDCFVELYNTQTRKWDLTDITVSAGKPGYGYLALNFGDVISKL